MRNEADNAAQDGLAWLRGKRILLAEDNITNQMVATQMLDALGCRVDVANDGAEALEMLERRRYDIYLIDIEMPRVSGLDVIRAIREADEPLCDAPVIAVTAYALREHREKIAEAGADGLIPKPLVGIEQFGRDILGFTERARRRGAGASRDDAGGPARRDDRQADADADAGDGPVAMSVFNGLKSAIGDDAMADLLGKIDGDLSRATRELSAGAAAGDMDKISAATHVLISVCGAVGAKPLQSLAQKMNAVAHGRGDGEIDALAQDIDAQTTVLRDFVRARAKQAG